MLCSVLDDHAPTKRKTANREHVPFITPEKLEAIRKRNKLKRLYNESISAGWIETDTRSSETSHLH